MESLTIENASYLRARDPSILAYNFSNRLTHVRTDLQENFDEAEELQQKKSEEETNLRVYLRIKSGYDFSNLYHVEGNVLESKVPAGSHLVRHLQDTFMRRLYTFTKIFDTDANQADIFHSMMKKKILDFINGQNSTLMTYGVSGSGKTFTVIGTPQNPGIIPRSLEYLFRSLPQLSRTPEIKLSSRGSVCSLSKKEGRDEMQARQILLDHSATDLAQHLKTYKAMQRRLSNEQVAELHPSDVVTISVWVSFAEIYNEQVFDLLTLDPPRGQRRPCLRLGCVNGLNYIKDLTNINITTGQEAFQILQYGIKKLNYASTQVNDHSSRSHSIFTIRLVQMRHNDVDTACVSSFNFCDLAGSERCKKTHNVGDRLQESKNINASLSVLGRCIASVRHLQRRNDLKVVPFRESKLTQLFQKALSGEEDIAMIVTISPTLEMFDESQHVLHFSAIAQDIKLDKEETTNRVDEGGDCRPDIEDLEYMISELRDELEVQRNEFEMMNQQNLIYVRSGYDKIIENMEEQTKERVADAVKAAEARHKANLLFMSIKHNREIEKLKAVGNEVVVLDSDDEELQAENAELKSRVEELTQQLVSKDEALKASQNELMDAQRLIVELKAKTEESKAEKSVHLNTSTRSVSKEQFDETIKENIILEEKVYFLEMELQTYQKDRLSLLLAQDGSSDEEIVAE